MNRRDFPPDPYEPLRGYPVRRCRDCGKPNVFGWCRFCRPPRIPGVTRVTYRP